MDFWSPYYRIDEYEVDGIHELQVNGIPHQSLIPVERAIGGTFYDQVYEWFPSRAFGQVLIIGAGSGTDVAVALAKGATHVDAVEIDPAIQQIGVEQHPDRPYSDPRVQRVVADGRAFLRGSTNRYDLIVFALPDSLTLASISANIGLESFLFTTEAFRSVKEHLDPDGVFVLYNYYREDWLPTKIGAMLQEAFGTVPIARLLRRRGGDTGHWPGR